MKSTLSLVFDAAKDGVGGLRQLFAKQQDAFLETIKWLAPVNTERWLQPLTMTMVSAVNNHIDFVDLAVRREASEIIVKAVTTGDAGESLTILSSLLLSMRPSDDDDDFASSDDHIDFERCIFDELKRCRWSGIKLVRILHFLRDIHIDNDMVDAIASNFSSGIIDCAASDLPSSCYSFIFLCEKMPQHCLAIMKTFVVSCETIAERAQKLSSDMRTAVLHAISTAVQSFSFSVKQDHQLSDAFLKLLKLRLVRLGPFVLSLLLTLVDSNRHKKTIFSYIITYALDSYRNMLAKSNSKFVPWVIQHLQKIDHVHAASDIGLFEDFDEILDNLLRNCESGWEFFIPNLVEICFQLLNLYDKSCRACHPALLCFPPGNLNKRHFNPKLLAARAGLRSLLTIFHSYSASRTTIIERIFFSILSDNFEPDSFTNQLDDHGDSSPSMLLLEQLVARNQVIFFEMASQIRSSIDHLMNMPSYQSCQLIRILVPIITKRKDLNDALTITIRKSLFSRHLHHRVMAVDIMLTLVNNLSGVQPSVVQFSQSSSSNTMASSDSQLFLEFKGLLHRVLSQQAQIRSHLYGCLQKCFQSGSPALRRNIFELLQTQLSSFVDSDSDEKLPFCIDLCIQSGAVIEPLPVLFHQFSQCVMLLRLSNSTGLRALYEEGFKIVDSIVGKLSHCNLEDFAYERAESARRSQISASLASAPDSIVRDNLRLSNQFWLEIHEIAINFVLMTSDGLNSETLEKVFKLHKNWEQLKPSTISRVTLKRKSSDKSSITKYAYFSLKACNLVLGTMYGHFDSDHNRRQSPPNVIATLRDSPDFIQYCLSSAITDAQKSFSSIRNSLQSELFLSSCCSIAPKLFRQCLRDVSALKEQVLSSSSGRIASGKLASAFSQSLLLFQQLLDNVAFFGVQAFSDFYRSSSLHELAIFEERRELGPDNLGLFFESLEHLFSETCSDRDVVLTTEASSILSMLDTCHPFFSEHINARFDWISEIYRFRVVVPALSCSLLSYGYSIPNLRGSFKLLLGVAQDCVSAMGDIEEEVQPTASTELGFNCETTIPAVTVRILQLIESEFNLADWLLSIIKQVVSYLKEPEASLPGSANGFVAERGQSCLDSICYLLQRSFEVALELLKIRSKDTGLFKNVVGFIIRAFKFAISVVVVLQSTKRPPSRRFKEMLELVGSSVNPAIHSLIKFNQEFDPGVQRQSKSATKRKIEGEKKLIPELTNQMEKFEHCCIKYSKLFKSSQLESYFKRGSAFDFRFSVSKALGDESPDKRKKRKGASKNKPLPRVPAENDRMKQDDNSANGEHELVNAGEGGD